MDDDETLETPGGDAAPAWVAALRSDDGLFVADEHQRIVAWSPSAEAALGFRAEDVIGRPCFEVVAGKDIRSHPVCRPNCTVISNALRGRVTAAYDLASLVNKEGERIWVNNTVIIGRDDRNRPLIVHAFRPVKEAPPRTPAAGLPPRARSPRRADTQPGGLKPLSRRELEALRLLAAGLSTAEIAAAMTISPLTARNHISTVMRKLGARNRVECLLVAAECRLV